MPAMGAIGTSATRLLAAYDPLFREGDEATGFYEILSGTVRAYKIFPDGRRQIVAFAEQRIIGGQQPGGTGTDGAHGGHLCLNRRCNSGKLHDIYPGPSTSSCRCGHIDRAM